METLALRVDRLGENTLTVLEEWLLRHSPKYYLYEEVGDKTGKVHYQGVCDLDLKDKPIKNWRQSIRDLLNPQYKNAYSLAYIKKSNYFIYATKDKKMVLNKGYSEEYLKELEEQSYTKSAQTFAKSLYAKCKEVCCKMVMRPDGRKCMAPINTHDLIKTICDYFADETKVFDKFVIVRFATMIEYKLNRDHLRLDDNLNVIEAIHHAVLAQNKIDTY